MISIVDQISGAALPAGARIPGRRRTNPPVTLHRSHPAVVAKYLDALASDWQSTHVVAEKLDLHPQSVLYRLKHNRDLVPLVESKKECVNGRRRRFWRLKSSQ